MYRLIKNSFKKEILLCFVILSLLPSLISDSFLIRVFKTEMIREDEQQAREQMESVERVIQAQIGEFERISEALCRNEPVIQGLSRRNQLTQNRAYRELYKITDGVREYARFGIFDALGECRYSTGFEPDHSSLPVYWGTMKAARTNQEKLVIQDVTEYHYQNEIVLQAVRAIFSEDDECLGYVVIEISRLNLEHLLAEVIDEKNGVAILNDFWEEVYSNKNAAMGNLAETLRSRRMAGQIHQQGTDQTRYFVGEIGDTGLYVAVARTMMLTEDVTREMTGIMILMTVLSLGLCWVLAEIMSNSLSEPIYRLSDAMQIAENGNLDVRIESDRTDELGQLTHSFNRMTGQLKEYMEMQVRKQKELNEANIAMMQAQLNPHFLYNTLDTMKWIAKANHITELAHMASDLAMILRTSISDEKFVRLITEVEMVECYADIQRIRFQNQFLFNMEVPIELEDCMIPKLIIQPIVENSILHGLAGREEGSIFLNVYEQEKNLYIEVSDDGCGIHQEVLEQLNSRDKERLKGHLGFGNVDTILRLYYGESYGLHAENLPEGGTKVTITLPMGDGEKGGEIC